MASYRVLTIDLTEPADRRELIGIKSIVANVDVVLFEEGSDLRVHFGNGDGIPISAPGQSLVACPPEEQGIYISHGAQPGVSATLLIGFGGGVRQGAA